MSIAVEEEGGGGVNEADGRRLGPAFDLTFGVTSGRFCTTGASLLRLALAFWRHWPLGWLRLEAHCRLAAFRVGFLLLYG